MYKQLNSEQRYAICAMLQQGMIKNVIAKTIEVSNSTITRELQRNSNKRGVYNYDKSHRDAIRRRVKSVGNRSVSLTVKTHAIQLLVNEQWSPEQISGKLANEGINISHETIYKIIREDKKNFGTLYKSCRHRLKHRTKLVGARTAIKNRTSIHERPKEADGTRFGDFEMDTIVGKNCQDAILTITERKTNLLLMAKLEHGKDSTELAKTAVKLLKPYKKDIKTITTDNGTEFAAHSHITNELGVAVYFADPYASWQKGAIENANGLIRQYIPKGTSFKEIDDKFVENICIKLNARPRKKNNFHTPYECFQKYLC
jgi:transposase, IS30 family